MDTSLISIVAALPALSEEQQDEAFALTIQQRALLDREAIMVLNGALDASAVVFAYDTVGDEEPSDYEPAAVARLCLIDDDGEYVAMEGLSDWQVFRIADLNTVDFLEEWANFASAQIEAAPDYGIELPDLMEAENYDEFVVGQLVFASPSAGVIRHFDVLGEESLVSGFGEVPDCVGPLYADYTDFVQAMTHKKTKVIDLANRMIAHESEEVQQQHRNNFTPEELLFLNEAFKSGIPVEIASLMLTALRNSPTRDEMIDALVDRVLAENESR